MASLGWRKQETRDIMKGGTVDEEQVIVGVLIHLHSIKDTQS